MILITFALLFLLIGVWPHGRAVAIVLFLVLLGFGVWDVQRPLPRFSPSLAQIWEVLVATIG